MTAAQPLSLTVVPPALTVTTTSLPERDGEYLLTARH